MNYRMNRVALALALGRLARFQHSLRAHFLASMYMGLVCDKSLVGNPVLQN